MTAEDSDDDMEDVEEGIPMQGEDGQHYVVLEVREPGSASFLGWTDLWDIENLLDIAWFEICFLFRWSNYLSRVVNRELSKLGLDLVDFNLPQPGLFQ